MEATQHETSPPSGEPASSNPPTADPHAAACPSCGGGASPSVGYVYAVGRIDPRFPKPSVERELAQAIGRGSTAGLTDREALRRALSQRSNRYLVRQLCWVMSIAGLETFILAPRDPADYELLVETLRPTPGPGDLDVVIGLRGPLAAPEMCNGLVVPIVIFDQIYSFDRATIIKSVPRPAESEETSFRVSAEEVFDRLIALTDNAGASDEHRALNYLAVRYPAVYAAVAEGFARNLALTAIETRPSKLSASRRIVEVIITFTNRQTDVAEKQFARVDVTEEFPFLVTKLGPYYDR